MSVLAKFPPLTTLLLALLLSSCASMRSVMEWRDDSFSGQIDSLLVIAASNDGAIRRSTEDGYRARFEAMGLSAIVGYSLLDESVELTRESVEAALVDTEVDAVLVTRLLGLDEFEQYQPPTTHYYYRSYPRYYGHSMAVTTPGYYRRFKLLTLETNVYDRNSGKLLWSMQSETIDPEAAQDVIDDQIELTARRLSASGLLAEGAQ